MMNLKIADLITSLCGVIEPNAPRSFLLYCFTFRIAPQYAINAKFEKSKIFLNSSVHFITSKLTKMKLDLYQVDAFATSLFEGNPAAVCPLDEWLADRQLQSIAVENNLSETAYFVKTGDTFRLRWFTPKAEVDLCGHATLASAHVLFEHLGYQGKEIIFDSNSGKLQVKKRDGLLNMNFPATPGKPVEPPADLLEALEVDPTEVFKADDYMLVLETREQVETLDPNFFLLKQVDTRGIIVTAAGDDVDFVSRFFAPAVGIDEDPVTGSAHTMLTPYWSEKLGKKELEARQLSQRGGMVYCTMLDDRVEIAGEALTYLVGSISI